MTRSLFLRFPKLINFWRPLVGAGIRVKRVSPGMRSIDVEMRLTRSNRNYMGVHFGGSLFSMTDPFYMIMLSSALGKGFVVWDKAATIRFRRPGLATVRAHFELTDARLAEIRAALDRDGIHEPVFTVEVVDPAGTVVCTVERTLYCATKAAHAVRQATRTPANLAGISKNTSS